MPNISARMLRPNWWICTDQDRRGRSSRGNYRSNEGMADQNIPREVVLPSSHHGYRQAECADEQFSRRVDRLHSRMRPLLGTMPLLVSDDEASDCSWWDCNSSGVSVGAGDESGSNGINRTHPIPKNRAASKTEGISYSRSRTTARNMPKALSNTGRKEPSRFEAKQ